MRYLDISISYRHFKIIFLFNKFESDKHAFDEVQYITNPKDITSYNIIYL